MFNDLLVAIDGGKCAFLILLDLSAAFDTVDHELLLNFLEKYVGLSGTVLQSLRSYLSERSQCVTIKNILSHLSELIFGVPQGSVLGPLIFCIYTLPLCTILEKHGISYHIYADDTQLYFFFDPKECDQALQIVSKCVADVRSWMIHNKLKINDDKTEFLILTSQHSKSKLNCSLPIGSSQVNPSSSCRNLGVTFDNKLTMNLHISNLCRNMMFHLRKIGSIRSILSENAAAQLVHSLITSKLDYCNSLLYGLSDSQINRLQRIQNVAARIVSCCPKYSHMTPILHQLHWLPVRARITFKVLLLTYRCLNGTAPQYLDDLITRYSPARSLRSSSQSLLVVPKTRLKTVGQRAFIFASPHEWNKLPQDIKSAETVTVFKQSLKTHLFRMYYK